jgi:hypothetical protein
VKEIVDHVAAGKDAFKRELTTAIEAWHHRPQPTLADRLVDKAIEILRPSEEGAKR